MMSLRKRSDGTSLSCSLKNIFFSFYENALYFFFLNVIFLFALMADIKLFYSGHAAAGIILAAALFPVISAFICHQTIQRVGADSPWEKPRQFSRLLVVFAAWYGLIALFSLNSLFYASAIFSKGATLLNSFLFFFSVFLFFLSFGLILYWGPMTLTRTGCSSLFREGLILFFQKPFASAAATLAFIMIVLFTLIIFSFFFMPVFSLLILFLSEGLMERPFLKNSDCKK